MIKGISEKMVALMESVYEVSEPIEETTKEREERRERETDEVICRLQAMSCKPKTSIVFNVSDEL